MENNCYIIGNHFEVTVKHFWLIFAIPGFLFAQDLEFELDPDAFPVEIVGWLPQQPWAGGIEDATPELCDIDADGDLDFFTGTDQNYYWFFDNNGNSSNPSFKYISSTFDSILPICPGVAGYSDIEFVDIDADSDHDAFLCNGIIGLIINNGTASQRDFSISPDTLYDQYGDYLEATNMASVDIDIDGDYDLFGGAYYSGELRFFKNTGTPEQYEFQLITESWQGIQVSDGHPDPCFGDLDNDGDLDLLVGTGAGNIYYYLNEGDSLDPQMSLVTSNFFGIDVDWDASPELVDIDNDGDLDLFVGRGHQTSVGGQGNISYFENIGNPDEANFVHRTDNYLLYDDGWHSRPLLVDIDDDGDPDLFSRLNWELIFFRNTGSLENPYFTFETDFWEGIEVYGMYPWFYDVDQDGDLDLFVGKSSITGIPQIYLYLNRGTVANPDYILYSDDLVPGIFNEYDVNPNISMADIDADGDDDLFVSTSGEDFHFFENNSSSSQILFEHITSSWQNIIDPYFGSHMYSCFYDIDNDNDLDLFVSNDALGWEPWDKNLVFYRNIGDSVTANMVLENSDVFPELMVFNPAPFLIDMDLDGDGDMFVGDTWGGIRYFKNTMNDTSSVPPPYQKCPYPCMRISLGPNPANPTTWVTFNLPYPQKATLAVYNLLGQKVATLAQGLQPPGVRTLYWDSSPFSSGVYLIEMETEMGSTVERLTVLK